MKRLSGLLVFLLCLFVIGQTFVNAAIRAVEKWEFEPVVENGVAIQKRAAVRMMFAIE